VAEVLPNNIRILVAEDDPNIQALLVSYLEAAGFVATGVSTGTQALAELHKGATDLLVLDLMIPQPDGFEICETVRKRSNLPIIILSAREAEQDRIRGLSLGADDYVVKPFSPRELLERIHAILRRVGVSSERDQELTPVSFGPLVLDPDQAAARVAGEPLTLTPSEFRILLCLMRAPGRVFSRAQLLDAAEPGKHDAFERTIDVHIANLRRKLSAWPALAKSLQTVRGFGYKFSQPTPEI
jgi:DNA-binding response OmpR family regulator